MARMEYIPKFTVSGKTMQLIMEIAAALERYKIVMEGPDGVRLRKLNHIRTIRVRGSTAPARTSAPGQDEPNTAETVFANFFNFDFGMLKSKDPKEAIDNVVDGACCGYYETPEEERAAQKRLMAIMQRRFAA